MNGNGLSDKLNKAFPNLIPIARPKAEAILIRDPNWLVGFTEAEGCFHVVIQKSKTTKTGFSVSLRFILTQCSRDRLLFDSLKNYLDCGICSVTSDSSTVYLTVNKFVNITQKIIPFFDKYPLVGAKAKDYFDFKEVAELMKEGAHLTPSGLEKIKQIKLRMNRARNLD